MMTWDGYKKYLLALVMWREARGEGDLGMRAVGHVIRNRVKAEHLPFDWEDVIVKKWQFSSMTAPGDSQLVAWPKEPDERFNKALGWAEAIFEGADEDPTHGALFYWNPRACKPDCSFAKTIAGNPTEHPQVAEIGNHIFYK